VGWDHPHRRVCNEPQQLHSRRCTPAVVVTSHLMECAFALPRARPARVACVHRGSCCRTCSLQAVCSWHSGAGTAAAQCCNEHAWTSPGCTSRSPSPSPASASCSRLGVGWGGGGAAAALCRCRAMAPAAGAHPGLPTRSARAAQRPCRRIAPCGRFVGASAAHAGNLRPAQQRPCCPPLHIAVKHTPLHITVKHPAVIIAQAASPGGAHHSI